MEKERSPLPVVGPLSLSLFLVLFASCNFGSSIYEQPDPQSLPPSSDAATLVATEQGGPGQVALSTSTPGPTPTVEVTNPSTTAAREVLASYFVGWMDGGGELEACLLGYGQYTHILYADGQLVIRTADGYREAQLSEDEVNDLLSRIVNTGFFQVQGDGSEREHDPIYAVPPDYLPPDGVPHREIMVLQKRVVIDGALFEYLIPEVRDAWHILTDYTPASTVAYIPTAFELWIYEVHADELSPEDYRPTPVPPTMEWPTDLPALRGLVADEGIARVTLSDESVLALTQLFPTLPSSRVVTQEGSEYLVGACPGLP